MVRVEFFSRPYKAKLGHYPRRKWVDDEKVAVEGVWLHGGLTTLRRESDAVCHVERSAAESRHLASNMARRSFAARFLRAAFGLGRNDKDRLGVLPNPWHSRPRVGPATILSCTPGNAGDTLRSGRDVVK